MSTHLEKLSGAAKAGTPGRLALKRGQTLCYERLVKLRAGSEEPTVTVVDFDNKYRTFYLTEIAAIYGQAPQRAGDASARSRVGRMPAWESKYADGSTTK